MSANEQLTVQELELLKKTIRKANSNSMRTFEETLNSTQLALYQTFVRERKIDTNTSKVKQQFKQDFIQSLDISEKHAFNKISEASHLNKVLIKLENILLVNDLLS